MENKDNKIIESLYEEIETLFKNNDELLSEFRERSNPQIPANFPVDASNNNKVDWLRSQFIKELDALPKNSTAGEVDIIYQSYEKLVYALKNPLQLNALSRIFFIVMLDKILKKKKLAIPKKSTKRKRTTLEESTKANKTDIKESQRKLRQEKLTPEEEIQINEDIKITKIIITDNEEDLMKLENQTFVPESFDMPEKSSRQLFKEIQAPARRKTYTTLCIVTLIVIVVVVVVVMISKNYI